jgi:hypothetical protein
VTARHFFRTTLGALAIVLAGACGDSTGPDFDDSFLEYQGESAGEWAYDNLYGLVQRMNFGSPSSGVSVKIALAPAQSPSGRPSHLPRFPFADAPALGAALQLAAFGCAVEASGVDEDPWDPIDANHNGIPDDYTVRYSCVEADTNSDSTVWIERYESRMRVKERAGVLHGYDVEQEYRELDEGSNGDRYEETHRYVERLAITASSASAASTYHGTWTGRESGVPWDERWGSEQAATFHPSATIVAGEELPDGELLLTGRQYEVYEDEPAVSFTLSGAGPLQYSASCNEEEHQPFVGGTLGGALNGDAAKGFLFTFSDCGVAPTFEVFGHTTPEE